MCVCWCVSVRVYWRARVCVCVCSISTHMFLSSSLLTNIITRPLIIFISLFPPQFNYLNKKYDSTLHFNYTVQVTYVATILQWELIN